jgi:hypothetical protein
MTEMWTVSTCQRSRKGAIEAGIAPWPAVLAAAVDISSSAELDEPVRLVVGDARIALFPARSLAGDVDPEATAHAWQIYLDATIAERSARSTT